MKKKHIQKLNDIEEKIAKLKTKLEKLEAKKDKIKHKKIDEVFDHMELSDTHLDDLKKSLEVIWHETREVLSSRFKKEQDEEATQETEQASTDAPTTEDETPKKD